MPNPVASWIAARRERRRARTQDVRNVDGFRVIVENPYSHIDNDAVVSRLQVALGLIGLYQPVRYRHLRRDVSQFWIARYPTRGVYFPQSATVLTEITFLHRVAAHSDAEVASAILHEGVHARIARMGRRLRFGWRWSAADEERVCRRAELAFARVLPPDLAEPIFSRVDPILEPEAADSDVAPVIDWRQAHLNKFIADMEDLNTPKWLRGPLISFMRFRLRRLGAS